MNKNEKCRIDNIVRKAWRVFEDYQLLVVPGRLPLIPSEGKDGYGAE